MQKIGKEVKIGLGVIGLLVAIFGFILVRRLTRPDDLPVATANSQTAAASTTSSTGKPIVVSATNAARPADAGGEAPSSRSLFTTDTGNEGRGSMMPEAGHSTADHDATSNSMSAAPASNPSPLSGKNEPDAGRSMFTSGAPQSSSRSNSANSDTSPADRFRQRNAPPDPTSSIVGTGNSAANGFASRATAPPIDSAQAPNNRSSSAAAAAPTGPPSAPTQSVTPVAASVPSTTPPSAAPDSSLPLGSSSDDPFQQKSANVSAFDKPSSAGAMPPPASPASDVSGANPLRNSPDNLNGPSANGPADDIASSSFRHRNGPDAASLATPPAATAGLTPPPITSSAINVPNSPMTSTMPGEPVHSPDAPPLAASGAPKPGQYVVQPDDNYWTISEKVYGTGGYFKAVYEHNRRQRAQSDRLQVGDVLEVPPTATLEQMYPDLCPKSASASEPATAAAPAARPGTRIYSVADGDTLYEIARHELGSPTRWGEIYQLNHDQLGTDFSYLRPGTQLLLPTDGGAESVARDPNAAMQR
jgi:nucleoid-associated protein YgaU